MVVGVGERWWWWQDVKEDFAEIGVGRSLKALGSVATRSAWFTALDRLLLRDPIQSYVSPVTAQQLRVAQNSISPRVIISETG